MFLVGKEATNKLNVIYCYLTLIAGIPLDSIKLYNTGFSSLVAAAAATQRQLASDTVRLGGSLQSQPITEGRRAGLVSGKAEVGMARPRMAKLRACSPKFGVRHTL